MCVGVWVYSCTTMHLVRFTAVLLLSHMIHRTMNILHDVTLNPQVLGTNLSI